MKFNVIKKFAVVAMLGAVACGFVGCKDDDDPEKFATVLAFEDPAQATLSFDATKSQQIIKLNTDATAAEITVEQILPEASADWCIVKVKSAKEITVDVAVYDQTVARSATYKIKVGKLTPIQFTVNQDAYVPPVITLSIDLAKDESGSYNYMAEANSPRDLQITVTTNAQNWAATLTDMMGEDDGALPTYCTLNTKSGASGDKIIIHFIGNNTNTMPNSGAKLTISAGTAEPIEVYINQNVPNATSVDIYDEDWNQQFNTNHAVTFAATATDAKTKQVFGADADGNIIPKICNVGTTVEATNPWLFTAFGAGSVSMYSTSANTGAARSLDVVLFGGAAGTTELFRFKVTQEKGN